MDRHSDTAGARDASEATRRARVREAVVTHAAVIAVAITSLGSVLSRPSSAPSVPAASAARAARQPCTDCGVVEAVVALRPADGFEVRIRMDDGSLRAVSQPVAPAAGSRVLVAGGMLRVLRAAGRQG